MKKLVLAVAALVAMTAAVLTGCQQPATQTLNMNSVINQGLSSEVDLSGLPCTADVTVTRAVTIKNGDFNGKTLTVNVSGVTLENAKNVNIVVSAEVGDGDFTVSGSEVSSLKVLGGGANSIHVKDTAVSVINIAKANVRVALEGKSNITKLQVQKGITAKVEVNSNDVKIEAAEVVAEDGSKVEGESVQLTVADGVTFIPPAGATTPASTKKEEKKDEKKDDTKKEETPVSQPVTGKNYTYNESLTQSKKEELSGYSAVGLTFNVYAYGEASDCYVIGVGTYDNDNTTIVSINYFQNSKNKGSYLHVNEGYATSFEASKTYSFVMNAKNCQLVTGDSLTGTINVKEGDPVPSKNGKYVYNEIVTKFNNAIIDYTTYFYGDDEDFYMVIDYSSFVGIIKGEQSGLLLQLDGNMATTFEPSKTYTYALDTKKYELVTSDSLTGTGFITVTETGTVDITGSFTHLTTGSGTYTYSDSADSSNSYKVFQITESSGTVKLSLSGAGVFNVKLQLNGTDATTFTPSTTYTFVAGKKTYKLETGSALTDPITVSEVNA